MSKSETFLVRWSRLKRGKGEAAVPDPGGVPLGDAQLPSPLAHKAGADMGATERNARAPCEPAPFDPASLPPIESITAGTDIRAFLQSAVPAELAKAALRRAWASDPAIRDFIEIAENQWDFTDPTSIPGFGPIEAAGDLHEMIARVAGNMSQAGVSSAKAPSGGAAPFLDAPAGQRRSALGDPASASVDVPTSGVVAGDEGTHNAPPSSRRRSNA